MSCAPASRARGRTGHEGAMNIAIEFGRVARRFPDHIAIDGFDTRLSYRELDREVRRLGNVVARAARGEFVVTLLEQDGKLAWSALGIMGAGKIFVPIDPQLPESRVATLLGQLDIGLIVTASKWLNLLRGALASSAAPPTVLLLDSPPDGANAAPHFQVMSLAAPSQSEESAALEPGANPHCYLYFTSGSTGKPKAVLGRTASLLHFIRWESRALSVTDSDRVSLLTAQMFDPFLRDLLLPLLNGATLCVPQSRGLVYSPAALLAWLSDQRVTILHIIPSMFQVLLEQRGAARCLQHLRYAALAGEMLKGALVDRFYSLEIGAARLLNFYGPTETTLAKLWYAVSAADRNRAVVPVGKPIDDTQAHVVDEQGRLVADGEVGEIYIATPFMSAGYLNAATETAARFIVGESGALRGQRLYRTGDLGRRLRGGDIELLGRMDLQVKIDGQRVELGEIEDLIERHPAVERAMLHFVERGGERKMLIASVKPRAGAPIEAAALREYLARHLPIGFIPAHYRCVEHFPLLPNGKLDRIALQADFCLRENMDAACVEPRSEQERCFAAIWQEVLRVDQVGVRDSFFLLGGTSLQAIRMLARIEELAGSTVAYSAFFRQPTIAGIAEYLACQTLPPQIGRDAVRTGSRPSGGGRTQGRLTLDQRRIFFFQHLNPDSCVYNMTYAADWTGPLDPALLRRAVQALVEGYDSLRAAFRMAGGEPVTEIHESVTAGFEYLDCESQDGARDVALRRIAADARTPFALDEPSLFRILLLRTAPAEHVLCLRLHHIIGDAWSFDLLWQALLAAYDRLLSGQPADRPAAKWSVLDFADWQAQQLSGPQFEHSQRYWRDQLDGDLPILQLPYDRDPAAAGSMQGSRFSIVLPAPLSASLKRLATAQGATVYMTLMAAFTAFLHRYTHQSDILIGTPVANRGRRDVQELIGFFVNILVIRSSVRSDATFDALLGEVRRTVLAALDHRDLPFDTLVELINPPRHAGVSPLFQAMLAWQEAPPPPRRIGPAHIATPVQVDNRTSKFDLTLELWDAGERLEGVFEYAADRFDPPTIARLAANFQRFLAAIVEHREVPVGRLPLLCEDELRLLDTWNETDKPFSSDSCIQHLIERQARQTPDGVAVVFEDERLTYQELATRANQLAHLLIAHGVGPEVAVGLSIERSADLVVGFLAILKAGGIYVPLDPEYPPARLRFMIEDAGLSLLLTQEKYRKTYGDTTVTKLYVDSDAGRVSACPCVRPPCGATADSTAYIIYTSGSTGAPKGVPIRHRGVCNLAEVEIELLRMTPQSRVLQFASVSFDASIWEIVMTLCAGGAVVMARSRALLPGPDLLAQLSRHRITHVTLPASALAVLPHAPLPDLSVLIVAGEACGLDLLRKWGAGRRFINAYGPTEASVCATNAELSVDAPRVHIGKPLSNAQVWLLDEQLQRVPIGVAGELYIGGVGLARGYHRRADLTAQRFIANPFDAESGSRLYRTGDVARQLADGDIEYLGRVDQQVKIRGFRVELGEIETVLRSHPAVLDAVAMVRDDYLDASGIVAYVLIDPAVALDPDSLAGHARTRVPDFMQPSTYVRMDAFPRLPNDKIDRSRFPIPATPLRAAAADESPVGAVEQAIAAVWQRLLGRSAIGRQASFFDLGGHSLLAAKSVALLAAEHGIDIKVRAIFEHQSIAALARVAAGYTASSAWYAGRTAAQSPLSYAQQRMWFLEQMEPAEAAYNICVIKAIHGGVDIDVLAQSVEALIARHAVFNIRLREQGSRVVQARVNEPPQYTTEGLGNVTDEEWEEALRSCAGSHAAKPFALLDSPLYRIHLLTASADRRAIILSAHHLLLDEYSLDLLDQDLLTLCSALKRGAPAQLPALPATYLDFALWEREQGEAGRWDAQRAYWQSVFATLPPALQLPVDFPEHPRSEKRGAGGVEPFLLDGETSRALGSLARRYATTPFTVMLAALQVLLHRYTGERDITVGVPVSVRPLPELDSVVGLFLNTLAVRSQVPGQRSFGEFLGEVGRTLGAAFEHSNVPYDEVVDAVDRKRERLASGLFQVMLAYKSRKAGRDDADLRISTCAVDNGTAKFDLSFFVEEGTDACSGKIEYRACLFRPETIRRVAAHFQNLLREIASRPDDAIASLQLMSASERDLLLKQWNATDAPVPEGFAHQWFEAQAARVPDAVAVDFQSRRQTYRDVNARANRLAHYLQAQGVGPNALVGIFLERSEDLIISILAVLKAGAAYVPIDSAWPAQRVELILDDAAASLLITRDSLAARLGVDSDRLLCVDRIEPALTGCSDGNPQVALSPDDLAYVIYTSGSTGRPKGVMIPHRGLSNYLAHALEHYDTAAGTGNPLHLSISFDATVTSLYVPLLSGKTIFIVPEDDEIESLGDVWRRETALTFAKITPAHLELLGRILPGGAAGHAAVLVVGGEALHAGALQLWRDCAPRVRVINEYGPTEATVGCCVFDIEAGGCASPGALPIGRPIANTRLYVLDEYQQPVPIGVQGELYIGGLGLARGYLNRPDLTASSFIRSPFSTSPQERLYKTGDVVKYLPDGNLLFLGRKDHQVKIRGFRIELGEIEAVLADHPSVLAAAAAVRRANGREQLVAYLVPAADGVDPQAVESYLAARLPRYMIPSRIVPVAVMPLTPNGKVDREALSRHDIDVEAVEYVEARGEIETTLVAIWKEVLGVQRVGIRDNFFQLGGDSILSLQIVFKARQAGLAVKPRMLFEHQTVAALASVTQRHQPPAQSEPPVAGAVELTPIQHWFFRHNGANPHHFNQSYLFHVDRGVDIAALESAFALVMAHHDALRARFHRTADSSWQSDVGAPTPAFAIAQERLPQDWRTRRHLEEAAARHQATLDIENGPLLKVVYFHDRHSAFLFVIVHHLAIDAVSWSILLEDLLTAYAALAAGRTPQLPHKTASYQQWARHLQAYAASAAIAGERAFWQRYLAHRAPAVPTDHSTPDAENLVASSAQLTVSLDTEQTRQLLSGATNAYYCNVSDILLAALAATLRQWTGQRCVTLDIERHGREGIGDGVDVSRTVGWFTAIHPLALEVPGDDDFGRLIKAVKESVRSIPHHGIGFGVMKYCDGQRAVADAWDEGSEICFNYLGRLGSAFVSGPLLGLVAPQPQNRHAAGNVRAYLIEIDAWVHGEMLSVQWTCNTNVHTESTLRALADSFNRNLSVAIGHCLAQPEAHHTPSDFPLAALQETELDSLQARHRNLEDVYPLSFTQEGILFHALSEPGSHPYFEQLCYRLHGSVDSGALRRAWQSVILRHPILRTCFDARTAGMPLQIVCDEVPLDWRELDWHGHSPQAAQDLLSRFLSADRGEGFDLQAGPAYRFSLIRRDGDEPLFVISHHHVILDGWSVGLLLEEVERCYRNDGAAALQSRPFRYYVQWQRLRRTDVARYWRLKLAGLEEATPLPAARSVLQDTHDVANVELSISPQTVAQLEAWARRHRLTLSTVMQGAWAILLNRYTGVQDCLFGVTVSGRAHALQGVESMVGLLISTLPCRIRLTPQAAVLAWLKSIQDEHLENEQHADLCLADIKQEAGLGWAGALFESILVFENYPASAAAQTPLLRFERAEERTNYPLTLVLSPRGGLHGHMTFHARHYSEEAVRALGRHFVNILSGLSCNPGVQLDAVSMLSSDERRALLDAWRSPRTPHFAGCAHELFERQVALTPEATALEYRQERISYATLNSRAAELAHYLRLRGVKPDQRVGIFLRRSPQLLVAILATLKAGGAYVPVDVSYPPERVGYLLKDSEAALVITETALLSSLPDISVECLLIDQQQCENCNTAGLPACADAPPATAGNLAYVIYTSGSTGLPKGAMIEHAGLVNYLLYGQRQYGVGPHTRSLFHSSIGFDATITSMLLPLICGGTVVVVPEELDVHGLARLLAVETPPHLLKITPVHLELLGKLLPPSAASKIAALVVGGEALQGAALGAWQRNAPDIRIFNEYGPTETVVGCCVFEFGARDSIDGNVPIGRPIDNTQLYILDARMEPVPAGAPGELYIGGAGVARGYLNRPELSAACFVRDPFDPAGGRLYKTGDRVRGLPDGNIEYIGRSDRQIKLRGYRIELGEIELQLTTHPAIRQSAVTLQAQGGQGFDALHLAAYYVPEDGAAPSSAELREYLRSRMPAYMIPGFFTTLREMPQTRNGKIDYRALPQPQQRASPGVAPRNDIEQCLCSIWEEVLETGRVGIEDNFFDLGGHSLKALRVIARIEQRLRVEVSLRELFDKPSILALSQDVSARIGLGESAPLNPIPKLSRAPRAAAQASS